MGRPSRLRASAYADGGRVRRSTVTGQADLLGGEEVVG
jgi:hypothetical protein